MVGAGTRRDGLLGSCPSFSSGPGPAGYRAERKQSERKQSERAERLHAAARARFLSLRKQTRTDSSRPARPRSVIFPLPFVALSVRRDLSAITPTRCFRRDIRPQKYRARARPRPKLRKRPGHARGRAPTPPPYIRGAARTARTAAGPPRASTHSLQRALPRPSLLRSSNPSFARHRLTRRSTRRSNVFETETGGGPASGARSRRRRGRRRRGAPPSIAGARRGRSPSSRSRGRAPGGPASGGRGRRRHGRRRRGAPPSIGRGSPLIEVARDVAPRRRTGSAPPRR